MSKPGIYAPDTNLSVPLSNAGDNGGVGAGQVASGYSPGLDKNDPVADPYRAPTGVSKFTSYLSVHKLLFAFYFVVHDP